MKKCVQFSLKSFGTAKYDCAMKTVDVFSFLLLTNSSITIWLRFLLFIIAAATSSKTINTLLFYVLLFNIFIQKNLYSLV